MPITAAASSSHGHRPKRALHQAKGVTPWRPCTRPSSTPCVNGGRLAVTCARWSMTAVAPVLVARSIGR